MGYLQMVRLVTALKRLQVLRLEACRGAEEVTTALSQRYPHVHVYQPRSLSGGGGFGAPSPFP